MNLFIKTGILIILIGFTTFSCNDGSKSAPEKVLFDLNDTPTTKVTKKFIPKEQSSECIDSIKLDGLGIQYNPVDENSWKLTYSFTPEEAGNIKEIVFISIKKCDKRFIALDTIILKTKKIQQAIGLTYFEFITEGMLANPNIQFKDYNFDGFMDFSIHSSRSGNKNEMRSYYLFNQSEDKFEFSMQLSEMVNLSIDEKSKTVNSLWVGGHSSHNHGSAMFTYVGDSLVLKTRVVQKFNNAINKFIKTTEVRQNNGRLKTNIDTIAIN